MHYPSKVMMSDPTDDEDKFNTMINMDMEQQRKNIKKKVIFYYLQLYRQKRSR